MVLIALSFQDQVEKYGVYVGIAAFFGLAVLSLLYFSQARELKRLREWAGRAPERAQELEQRVMAQAASARRPAMPGAPQGAIAPPRRLAEMPAPPEGAQSAAGAQATEVADAEEQEPATNGNVAAPASGAAGGPGVANGVVPPADGEAAEEKQAGDESRAGEDGAGAPADGEAAKLEPAQAGSSEPEAAESAGEPAVAPSGADADSEPAPAEATPAEARDAQPAAGEQAAETRPGEVPAAIPRATPAQRVGVAPRPAPMPLRQSQPSATPATGRGGGPRRPGAAPARKPAGAPREGRSAGTIALFVGLAVLILGGGTYLISQLGGEDNPPAPNRAAPPPTQTAEGGSDAPRTPPAETNVAVLNGTTFTGLAGQLADRISQEGGFERGATETNTRDQTIQTSTVYYSDGFRSQARSVARLLSISALEPLDADTQALAPDADVVVLAGADQAP